jgi:hypothetical protein
MLLKNLGPSLEELDLDLWHIYTALGYDYKNAEG